MARSCRSCRSPAPRCSRPAQTIFFILVPSPSASRMLEPPAMSCSLAPRSPSSDAYSRTVASWPSHSNGSAAVRPPIPAPAITIRLATVLLLGLQVFSRMDQPDGASALKTLIESLGPTSRQSAYPHNSALARAAPATRDSIFAQTTSSAVKVSPAKVPNPQSVPAMIRVLSPTQ